MTNKLELIQAAQQAAALSLDTKPAALPAAKKEAFAALAIDKANWQFFSDHFDGARRQYSIAAETPIEATKPQPATITP